MPSLPDKQKRVDVRVRDLIAVAGLSGAALGVGAVGLFLYFQNRENTQSASRRLSERRRSGGRKSPHLSGVARILANEMGTDSFTFDEESGDTVSPLGGHRSVKTLAELQDENNQLRDLLVITETAAQYGPHFISDRSSLSTGDINTIRAIFGSIDEDANGWIDDKGVKLLCSRMGEPVTEEEAKSVMAEMDPQQTGEISFNRFLIWWHSVHKNGKKGQRYRKKFKLSSSKVEEDFDLKNIFTKRVGQKATTEFRFTFSYQLKNGYLKTISPWHDIPLRYRNSINICHFISEVPKWTRAKYEIATGEAFNPIHQDVKNGKLRYYLHGDMMFNYGALPQTWENPKHIPTDTGYPGDNDPLDVVEIGTRQLETGSVTPVKVLGILALLDGGETDWKVLTININDPLANVMQDVHDIDKHMPGAIRAIREYLRIYKVCRGEAENKYAFRGEAMNAAYALKVIEHTHEQWKELQADNITTV